MNNTLDVLNSTLTSTLRLWRGTVRTDREAACEAPPALRFEACPFCRLVREALTELDLDALIYPTPHGGKRFRLKVDEMGGKQQFPFLVDPNTGQSMYESARSSTTCTRRYGSRPAPTRLLRPLHVSSSVLAGILRLAQAARRALEGAEESARTVQL